MRTNFNGTLKEIMEQYPNIDLPGYLADNLQLPLDKAEVLAARIEKQICQRADKTGQQPIRVLDKPAEIEPPKAGVYPVDCLCEKEFEYFTKWLFEELGYEIQPEQHAVAWGFDFVAVQNGEKIAVQARKYPKTYRVTNTILSLTEQAEQAYGCQRAIVLATTYFTGQACADAEKLGVELWNIETLTGKVEEVRKKADVKVSDCFPQFKGSLLQSLQGLEDSEQFIIEPKAGGKYDLHLLGVKYPLLTFQVQSDMVIRCTFRIKNSEPVGENEGTVLIDCDKNNSRVGPDDICAYELIVKYLGEFLK